MFDAKKLLESILQGGAPQPAQQSGGLGGLGDILGQVLGGAKGAPQQGQGGGGLADILGKLGQAAGQAQQPSKQSAAAENEGGSLGDLINKTIGRGNQQPQLSQPHQQQQQADAAGGGGLEDMLRKLQEQLGGAKGGAAGGLGGLGDILGQVFGQAKAGVQEGARRVDDATGASGHMREATKGVTGKDPNEILEQIKEWAANNQMGAGAAAGGLGAVVLGTKTGRSLAGKAFKLGALALIGGLAYKAVQNYQSGRPLISGDDHLSEAPRGTGYETGAVTQESALLYIRAMIAAAAADGRIDQAEQEKIFGSLKQVGMEQGAEQFVRKELQHPASIEELAAGVTNEQEAVQVYTAARVAVDPGNEENQAFLLNLAQALGMNGQLAQHIDAAARSAG